MEKYIDCIFMNGIFNSKYPYKINEVSKCPICKCHIIPTLLEAYSRIKTSQNTTEIFAIYLCPHCENIFLATYHSHLNNASILTSEFETATLVSLSPEPFSEQEFDIEIKGLSPQFIKIYNQALASENMKLDYICGIAFRKSLEFLLKDFCIHVCPADSEKIKIMPLSKCINDYIDDPRIKGLAEKCTWLGNDEAHYIKKHNDRDLSDLKKFIKALISYIAMVLTAEDSETIQKK